MITGHEITRQAHHPSLFSGSIDREVGMTESEKKAEAKALRESKAKALRGNLAQLPEGDFGAFDFTDNISMKTISKGKQIPGPHPLGCPRRASTGRMPSLPTPSVLVGPRPSRTWRAASMRASERRMATRWTSILEVWNRMRRKR